MNIQPLSPALGAEVTGIDLRAGVDDRAFAAIHDAWLAHSVLVVRDQPLDTAQQLAFAQRFGELEEVRTKKDDPATRQHVMFVSNRIVEGSKGVLPDGEMFFHSDQCYYERPCKATMLNAMQLPSRGGETLFSNVALAYDELSPALKQQIIGRLAVNVYDYDADPTRRNPVLNPSAPQFVHPLVAVHPETGRRVIYANRQMTHHIVGMDRDTSEALLQAIFDHVEQPRFVYEHRWRDHDLVIWDNRAVLHARRDFDPGEARVLRRTTVKGTRPVPAASI